MKLVGYCNNSHNIYDQNSHSYLGYENERSSIYLKETKKPSQKFQKYLIFKE